MLHNRWNGPREICHTTESNFWFPFIWQVPETKTTCLGTSVPWLCSMAVSVRCRCIKRWINDLWTDLAPPFSFSKTWYFSSWCRINHSTRQHWGIQQEQHCHVPLQLPHAEKDSRIYPTIFLACRTYPWGFLGPFDQFMCLIFWGIRYSDLFIQYPSSTLPKLLQLRMWINGLVPYLDPWRTCQYFGVSESFSSWVLNTT